MAMTRAEAEAVQSLLSWLFLDHDDPLVPGHAEARDAASLLADRSISKLERHGVRGRDVVAWWDDIELPAAVGA